MDDAKKYNVYQILRMTCRYIEMMYDSEFKCPADLKDEDSLKVLEHMIGEHMSESSFDAWMTTLFPVEDCFKKMDEMRNNG